MHNNSDSNFTALIYGNFFSVLNFQARHTQRFSNRCLHYKMILNRLQNFLTAKLHHNVLEDYLKVPCRLF